MQNLNTASSKSGTHFELELHLVVTRTQTHPLPTPTLPHTGIHTYRPKDGVDQAGRCALLLCGHPAELGVQPKQQLVQQLSGIILCGGRD